MKNVSQNIFFPQNSTFTIAYQSSTNIVINKRDNIHQYQLLSNMNDQQSHLTTKFQTQKYFFQKQLLQSYVCINSNHQYNNFH